MIFGALAAGLSAADTVRAATPTPRLVNYSWMSLDRWFALHQADVVVAQEGSAPVVFLGDSITEGFEHQEAWKTIWGPLGAANFGIGGDMTQNVLWRLAHGATGNLAPQAVVVLIGVNNFGLNDASPEEVSLGVRTVVYRVRETWPEAEVLVYGVFPSGREAGTPRRTATSRLNADLATLALQDNVHFEEIGAQFLDENGAIPVELMADALHPTPEGYRIWAVSLQNRLAALGVELPSAG